jgi:hypothetical protein
MPPKGIINVLYEALDSAGFSFADATAIGVRTFMLPKTHREAIRYNIISKCKSGTLKPESADGQKLIKLARGLLK